MRSKRYKSPSRSTTPAVSSEASVTAVLVRKRMICGSTMSHRVVSAAQKRSKNRMRR